jgi:DNA-directed RNA polymerase beta' subunit
MEDSLGKVSNISRVIGIQFSILSPDEIRNGSVAQMENL